MLKCVRSVLKLAIAVRLSVRSMTTTTANAALHPAAVAPNPVVKWLEQWHKLRLQASTVMK
ncbi:hypothetical protein WA1_47015 [Scytonema hofmannii PCC 7110]|uniref:Uncharacterized protein n=1 Tax=Scytonema hofmannii PCC 7110 TaxID=128403 RepID=A0A139WXL3_9CYAN|nr:hypothetical protein WA1_47015 [Scytonema hofmannii PCC 7110]